MKNGHQAQSTLRIRWAYEWTKEMKTTGKFKQRLDLDKIKKEILQNENKLKYVVAAKSTHPDIATGINASIKISQEDV